MGYKRGIDMISDQIDHLKFIWFWVSGCSFQKKIKENGTECVCVGGGRRLSPIPKVEIYRIFRFVAIFLRMHYMWML